MTQSLDPIDAETDPVVEAAAEAIHVRWMRLKQSQGLEQMYDKEDRPLMIPYRELAEANKDMHRQTVKTVMSAFNETGYLVVRAH